MKHQTATKQAAIYVGITFLITYLFELTVVAGVVNSPELQSLSTAVIALCMFFPTIGMLITRLVTREGFHDLWIKPNFRGNAKIYLAAWLLPVLLIFVGAALYFIIFPADFDWSMGLLVAQLEALGAPMTASAARTMIFAQIAVGLISAPLLNFIPCLGEEWGWRGYMMPRLIQRFSFPVACLVGGVIWGLWHAPLTVMGHNYGVGYFGYPYLGILCMCIFCTMIGTLMSYLSLRAKSCIPAVIAHAVINGMASAPMYFLPSAEKMNVLVGPLSTGVVGVLGFLAAAVICLLLARKKPFETAPAPQAPAPAIAPTEAE